ncbi:hypothetical protein BYT27DRAFT_7212969 [Phlegmacium glaucopus]|nr:hypothetical protein BYT27DRAFT_7212969 [Phlegmacium glaucopus]
MSWNDQNVTQLEYLGITKRAHLQTKDVIYRGFSPYFQVFRPLIDALMGVLFTTPDYYTSKSAVTHQAFIAIFENVLSTLPPEPAMSRPPTHAKPAVKRRIFDDEDGDLTIGSEPVIRKPSIKPKQLMFLIKFISLKFISAITSRLSYKAGIDYLGGFLCTGY